MKKIIKTTKTIYLCDRCQKDCSKKYSLNHSNCCVCKKDLCNNCFKDFKVFTGKSKSNYAHYYVCSLCMNDDEINKKYKDLENVCEERDKLYAQFRSNDHEISKKQDKIEQSIVDYIDSLHQTDTLNNE